MTMETALLTLDTLAKYLKEKEVQLDMEENNGQRFIRMGWRFEMGDAAVLVSVNDGPNNTSRLEVTCVTQKQYGDRRAEIVNMLNDRNRERAFARSIDADGNVWLEYGLLPHPGRDAPGDLRHAVRRRADALPGRLRRAGRLRAPDAAAAPGLSRRVRWAGSGPALFWSFQVNTFTILPGREIFAPIPSGRRRGAGCSATLPLSGSALSGARPAAPPGAPRGLPACGTSPRLAQGSACPHPPRAGRRWGPGCRPSAGSAGTTRGRRPGRR